MKGKINVPAIIVDGPNELDQPCFMSTFDNRNKFWMVARPLKTNQGGFLDPLPIVFLGRQY